MRATSSPTPLVYAGMLFNASVYLIVPSVSVQSFMVRHDPSWSFLSCEACRQTGSSYVTWGSMIVGLAALFVRRSEAILVLFLVNIFLLVDVAWGPLLIVSHVLKQNGGPILVPALHPFVIWSAQVSTGALIGSGLLAIPSVRRALSGKPAAQQGDEAACLPVASPRCGSLGHCDFGVRRGGSAVRRLIAEPLESR